MPRKAVEGRQLFAALLIVVALALPLLACGESAAVAGGASSGPAAPTAAKSTPVTVLSLKGTGTKNSKEFTLKTGNQTVSWTCDPASFDGAQFNVQVAVDDVATHTITFQQDGLPVNTLCNRGNTHDSTEIHLTPGTYYLAVNSEGAWTVKVTDNG